MLEHVDADDVCDRLEQSPTMDIGYHGREMMSEKTRLCDSHLEDIWLNWPYIAFNIQKRALPYDVE